MSLKILHLEDNMLDAELVEASLCESNFTCNVTRVDTRADFTAAVTEQKFDLILADYSLPSFDGLKALKIARAFQPDTPFIIISGALGEELAIETLKNGATDYILKHRLQRLAPSVMRALREVAERKARKQAENERALLLLGEQEARLKAEEANRLKDEFLATVSHELRTPLNAILGWTKMLRSGNLELSDVERALEIVERNAKVQVQLIEDLLDVSRIITGKLNLEIKKIDLIAAVKTAIDAVRPAAAAKSIAVATEFQNEINAIYGDANRLQQIVWNLLSNAVKFTAENGFVRVSLSQNNDFTEIKITDSGEGITPEFLPFVFDRFRQAEQSTTRRHGGLGLGLSIVRHLVEMHGGTVVAESDGVGFGATFTVRLPQPASSAPIVSENKTINELVSDSESIEIYNSLSNDQTIQLLDGTHILLVDDDEDSLEMLQIMLAQSGAQVTVARSALEAFEKFEQSPPDVLVSDIGMPDEDGYSLIKKIRSLGNFDTKRISAIALTGFARREDRELALSKGFDSHVTKPIEPKEFVQVILDLTKNN